MLNTVIGFGNPLREDDGLGLRAAEFLEASGIDVLRCYQLTPELAVQVADSNLVIFLDAAGDLEPGTVRCTEVAAEQARAWTHHLTPGQLLGFTGATFGRVPRAILIAGGAHSLDYGEELSLSAEQCAQQMAGVALLVMAGAKLHAGSVQALGNHA